MVAILSAILLFRLISEFSRDDNSVEQKPSGLGSWMQSRHLYTCTEG